MLLAEPYPGAVPDTDREGKPLSRRGTRSSHAPDLLPALERLGTDGVAALLRDVPCLADAVNGRGPLAPTWPFGNTGRGGRTLDLAGLARLLEQPEAIYFTLASLDLQAFALAQLAVWHGGGLTRGQAIAEAPHVDPAELDVAADRLRARLLTMRGRGWLTLRAAVEAQIGLPGPPVAESLQWVRSDQVAGMLRSLGRRAPSTKADRVVALVAALRDPEVVERAVDNLPAEAGRIFELLVRHGPQRLSDLGVPFWSSFGHHTRGGAVTLLVECGLAGVDMQEQVCMLWLDTLVGLRGGRLFDDAFPHAPGTTTVALPGGVPSLPPLLEHLDALLSLWQARPADALAGGGLGVRPVRAAGKSLGRPSTEIGLMASLAAEIGLLGKTDVGTTGRGRNRKVEQRWSPTPLLERWRELPAAQQWAQLVETWRASAQIDEFGGLPERYEPNEVPGDATTIAARAVWLRLLADLPDGAGIAEDDLRRVAAARYAVLLSDPTTVDGLLAAGRALGLVPASGPVGLTVTGRAVLEAPEALADVLPEPSMEVVVQADMTVMVPPDAAPEISATVARWAELETAAGARTYRLSDRRIAGALAAGADGDEMLAWLAKHSRVAIPQNVEYLIRDIARRRGQVRAGTATSYLRCDDPALLTQAVAVRGAKLRLLAPTVAVSSLARDKLLAALTDGGIAVVAEDPSGAIVDAVPPQAERVGWQHSGSDLPALQVPPAPAATAARLLRRAGSTDGEASSNGGTRRSPKARQSRRDEHDDPMQTEADDILDRLMQRQAELDAAIGDQQELDW